MGKYKLVIKLKDSNEKLDYIVNLNKSEEDNPALFFIPEACEKLRSQLQNEGQRRINDTNLNYIVNTWMKEIQLGHRDTIISLILPLLSGANIQDLNEPGNQNLPALMEPDLFGIEPQDGALPDLIFS